jgi:hypothetical protein
MKRSANEIIGGTRKEVEMRGISLLVLGATLASCAAAPPQPMRTLRAQSQYDQLLAGKVPGKPVSCLPSYKSNDMVTIDDSTIAFKQGSSTVYVNHMLGGCSNLSGGSYALLTRQFGGSGLCRGDIAQVVDTLNHITVGSCVFGDFVPYSRPGVRTY